VSIPCSEVQIGVLLVLFMLMVAIDGASGLGVATTLLGSKSGMPIL
jgi:hypothetical protein